MTFAWSKLLLQDSELEDVTLTELYRRCEDAHSHLSDLPADTEHAQALLRQVLRMLQHCDAVIDAVGMFSNNETQEDIATSSLRCVQGLSFCATRWFVYRSLPPLHVSFTSLFSCDHACRFVVMRPLIIVNMCQAPAGLIACVAHAPCAVEQHKRSCFHFV